MEAMGTEEVIFLDTAPYPNKAFDLDGQEWIRNSSDVIFLDHQTLLNIMKGKSLASTKTNFEMVCRLRNEVFIILLSHYRTITMTLVIVIIALL